MPYDPRDREPALADTAGLRGLAQGTWTIDDLKVKERQAERDTHDRCLEHQRWLDQALGALVEGGLVESARLQSTFPRDDAVCIKTHLFIAMRPAPQSS